ncbi:hypothetical protein BO78DRAFT_404937 [Aspergillus sclerotiicarbonarius CBS 121057]|uniref:Uncharacterized protein n=1 Tax=Aspergillus sclerotiicarbonarius (strain CBS 121057 / IBT 28362) TaxID=1448318 RepID=A0A319EGH0_ASPSB|nr:hypothetical protein BO78DRAFT_404937 [Aspergillus sclerotiicarbonarius CBS 121057]
MSQPQAGRLASLVDEHPSKVVLVPMNSAKAVSFHQAVAIGTAGLGGCSAIVIASTRGAILAHIPPRPPSAPLWDLNAGDRRATELVTEVIHLYRTHYNEYFSRPTETVILCALFNGSVGLPDQLHIMRRALGPLAPAVLTYDVPGDQNIPGKGTMFAMGSLGFTALGLRNEGRARIFVEDKEYRSLPPA